MWDRPQIRYMGLTKQGQRGSAICGKKMKMKKKMVRELSRRVA